MITLQGDLNFVMHIRVILFQKAPLFCGPQHESCVSNQTLKDDSCFTSCDGLNADIADDLLQQKVLEGVINFDSQSPPSAIPLYSNNSYAQQYAM